MFVAGVTFGVLGGSADITAQVRSGSPGYRQAKSGRYQYWHRRALTVHIDGSMAQLGPAATDAVTRAFGHWVESDPRLPDLSFDTGATSATPKRDGKSTVSYTRIAVPGHERDLAITMTYSEEDSGEIVEADVVLNSLYPMAVLRALEHNWRRDARWAPDGRSLMSNESEDCQNRFDVQNVLSHEAGHFFGLGEDPVEQGATMFQAIDQCETHKRAIIESDAIAIRKLYAEAEDPDEAEAGPSACSVEGARAADGDLAWASVLVVGVILARRRRCTGPRSDA
jgi:hypothetical protein